jgi:hypothetical protein
MRRAMRRARASCGERGVRVYVGWPVALVVSGFILGA